MEDSLYDTSWTLSFLDHSSSSSSSSTTTTTNPSLISSTNSPHLQTHLSSNRPTYETEEEHEKLGQLLQCTWSTTHHNSSSVTTIELTYEKSTCRFQIHNSALLLTRAGAGVAKRVYKFLTERFGIVVVPMRLSGGLVQGVVERYLERVVKNAQASERDARAMGVGGVKITLGFGRGVAPLLRTVDVDVVPETVVRLVVGEEGGFGVGLRKWVGQRTGLIIPLAQEEDDEEDDNEDGNGGGKKKVVEVTKITSAAFAIGIDGKLKLAGRAVQVAKDAGFEDVMRKANAEMLDRLIKEAVARGKENGG